VQARHKVLAVTPAVQQQQQHSQLQLQQQQLVYNAIGVSKHVLTFLGQHAAAAAAVAFEATAARVDSTVSAAATQQSLVQVLQRCTLARTSSSSSSTTSAVTWQSVRRSELLVRVALTAEQQRAYSSILVQNSAVLAGGECSSAGERTRSVALQLIHACAHPAAVADSSGSSSSSGSGTALNGAAASTVAEAFALDDAQQLQQLHNGSSNSSVSSSGKLQLVQSMLIRLLKSKGDRVLLFSQFPDM
jgi:hypothetical protein